MDTNEHSDGQQVLITGGTGFVGRHLIRCLKPRTASITVLGSRIDSGADPDVEYLSLDIRDRNLVQSVVHQVRPTRIYHLASISSVGVSGANPRLAYEVNVLGTYNVFEAA